MSKHLCSLFHALDNILTRLFHSQACVHAKVDLGVATVEADVHATATVDLSEGKVDATAKAKLDVDAGPAHLDSDVNLTHLASSAANAQY